MSNPFNPLGGTPFAPTTNWSPSATLVSTFVPFPAAAGSPGTDEIGYDEGGYGQGGYDTPGVPAIFAPTTQWSIYTTK